MYVIRLKIKQTEYFDALADKRFALINKCHNVLVKHCIHLLNRLEHDAAYKELLKGYRAADSKKGSKEFADQMNEYRRAIGLSKSGLESYIKVWQSRYRDNISSHQAQKEAVRVMAGVDKVLFGNGETIHFRKLSKTTTICGKSPQNGLSFDRETMTFKWMKDIFALEPIDKDNEYLVQAFYPNGLDPLPLSYCEIKRMMFPNGWHYYLNLYVKGTAPQKHAIGVGTAGVDPGTSTMAVVADNTAMLRQLAAGSERYINRIKKIARAMDQSRRASNPQNYNPDGTVIKGRKKWQKTRQYRILERKQTSLYRQKALYTRQSHCILANEVLENANIVIVEHMDYRALQRRSKKTERQDEPSLIKDNKGKDRAVYKYKKKKRFGRSLGSRAPSLFLTILRQKVEAAGGEYLEVDTSSFKASQYDHAADTYTKVDLSQRFKIIDGIKVQRDLYSAFLLKHSNTTLDSADREACIYDFKNFVKLQNEEIAKIKAFGQSLPECFGF